VLTGTTSGQTSSLTPKGLWAKEFFQGQVMSISGTPNAVWIEQAARSAPNIEEVLCVSW
jgi:hypothetical protein